MATPSRIIRLGAPAPSFELDSTLGRRLSLDEFKGQSNLMLVFLRGLGCQACIRQLMRLKRDQSRFAETGTEVLVVAPHGVPRLARHLENYDLPFAGLADPQRTVFAAYQVREGATPAEQRPALFVVDKSGIVRYAHLGQQSDLPSTEEVVQELNKLAA